MLFSDSIPDNLKENPNVLAFMNVLDSLQNSKTEIISESFRTNNSAILLDKKWILKRLDEFGISDIPLSYPIQILIQYLLNVDTVCRTRGSKIGIELYCSLLSLGEATIDDSNFYAEATLLLLDSVVQGYITENNKDNRYYLCDDNDNINSQVELSITIKSRFFNGDYPFEEQIIKNYIEKSIKYQLGFCPDAKITFNYQKNSDFYYHELLNPYFV